MRDDLQGELISLLVGKAIAETPLPTWAPGTVLAFNSTTYTATVIGDEPGAAQFEAHNLTGAAVVTGQRVMVRFVPPSGAFIDGLIGVRL